MPQSFVVRGQGSASYGFHGNKRTGLIKSSRPCVDKRVTVVREYMHRAQHYNDLQLEPCPLGIHSEG